MPPDLAAFATRHSIPKWGLPLRPVVCRKRVSHRTRKNFQLDLFSSDDGHYEYSAIESNKRLRAGSLWKFMAGRGGHEKTLGELRQHLAFDTIPRQARDANSTQFLLTALTHHTLRQFQLFTRVRARAGGRAELRVAASPLTR